MTDPTIHQVLARYWGYNAFRPMQEEIIRSVLSGRDTLALLPTGGGKSLCFQVPGMVTKGITLVITPLIALMKDQVENLKSKGIPAEAVYSGMTPREVELAMNHVLHGQARFLYLSPERLLTERFQTVLDHISVGMIAVDEAHCISQWGYDFRPPYLRIAEIRDRLPGVPVLALTATATRKVVKDIQDKLRFQQYNVFERSFERNNLAYVVSRTENKIERLLRICTNVKGSGIVYVRNRRKTREVSGLLVRSGIRADYYHAGLDPREREKKQDAWKSGSIRVMVSTNAFGMGIDKPDVRFVVHLDLPDSPEAYFQEAGRAGRDGKKAFAVLLFEEADILDARHNLDLSYPEPDFIRRVYKALGNYLNLVPGTGRDTTHLFDINDFCNQYDFRPVVAYNSLKFIEKEGFIVMNEAMSTHSKLVFNTRKDDLYRFQVEHAAFDPLIKMILRSYGGVFSEPASISEADLGQRLSVSAETVAQLLTRLHQLDVLTYVPRTDKPQITFSSELIKAEDLRISPQYHLERKQEAVERLGAVIDYATTMNRCRSQMLIAYFGQSDSRRCGICDVCLERNKANLSELEFNNILEVIKPMLKEAPCSLKELTDACSRISEEKVINAVTWLTDNDKIDVLSDGFFRWSSGNEEH
ncbi:ATP-dependent DNA helicase RecQ [Lentimicrobium sp.]|uniref:RecQ family ATP-dependent DNA helicase n=1 Tax=Lentimicrobium sp. TaxID=2034841 RepID=UPI00345E779E